MVSHKQNIDFIKCGATRFDKTQDQNFFSRRFKRVWKFKNMRKQWHKRDNRV